jgi:cytoskeletal protein CcmA (bactofilin family)
MTNSSGTVIGKGICIRGEVSGEEDLVVFGRVEGSVKASGRAELKHSAVFVGDISATRLSIEDNATLQGYVDLSEGAQPPKKQPAKKEQAQAQPEPEEAAEYVEQFSEAV